MKIEHIAMYVNDLRGARDFFVKYLGAVSGELYHNKKTDFKSYFLSFDGGARIEIMNKPQLSDAKKTWLEQDTFTLHSASAAKKK